MSKWTVQPWIAGLVSAMLLSSSAVASDPDEALYLSRFNQGVANGLDSYDPLEAVPGAPRSKALPKVAKSTITPATLDEARAYAAAANSKTLLVWRDGKLEDASYFGGADASTLIISRSMAKPLAAIAVGRAIHLGKIKSLDQPAADFIAEWRGTPKAAVTIRQLLDMTAGFLAQGYNADPSNIWSRSYLHPRFERIIVNEYPLAETPGATYNYANATADMIAIVIERATGRRYAPFVSDEVLKPLGAAGGQIWVNRPGGMAHSGCCILLPAETWLRLGLLVMDDGVWSGKRLLPDGYVAAMRTASKANSRYGLGVWVPGDYIPRRGFGPVDQHHRGVKHGEPFAADDLILFDGNANQVLYIVPSKRLAILRMGGPPPKAPEWDNSVLPNLILRGLAQ